MPNLVKALKGLVVMSSELEAMGHAMFINTVPRNWEDKAYLNEAAWSLGDELVERTDFITKWVKKMAPGRYQDFIFHRLS